MLWPWNIFAWIEIYLIVVESALRLDEWLIMDPLCFSWQYTMWQWKHTTQEGYIIDRISCLMAYYLFNLCVFGCLCSLSLSLSLCFILLPMWAMAPLDVVEWCTMNSVGRQAWCTKGRFTHRPRAMTMKIQGPLKIIQKVVPWDVKNFVSQSMGPQGFLKVQVDHVKRPDHIFLPI